MELEEQGKKTLTSKPYRKDAKDSQGPESEMEDRFGRVLRQLPTVVPLYLISFSSVVPVAVCLGSRKDRGQCLRVHRENPSCKLPAAA